MFGQSAGQPIQALPRRDAELGAFAFSGRQAGAGPGLHFDLNFANLCARLIKNVGLPGCKLPYLGSNRAITGIDNDFPLFQIGHPAVTRQRRRNRAFIEVLEFQKTCRMGGKPCQPGVAVEKFA